MFEVVLHEISAALRNVRNSVETHCVAIGDAGVLSRC